jgi:hypothetical protein
MTNNVLNWLIEDENPAIKYRTLIELNDKNPADYQDCYNKIWEQKQIKKNCFPSRIQTACGE